MKPAPRSRLPPRSQQRHRKLYATWQWRQQSKEFRRLEKVCRYCTAEARTLLVEYQLPALGHFDFVGAKPIEELIGDVIPRKVRIAIDRIGLADVTDHIKPHRGDVNLFWDRSNWAGCCKACHTAKTARGE